MLIVIFQSIAIGKDAKDVSTEDALAYVAAYTCGNEISSRKLQRALVYDLLNSDMSQCCWKEIALLDSRQGVKLSQCPLVPDVHWYSDRIGAREIALDQEKGGHKEIAIYSYQDVSFGSAL